MIGRCAEQAEAWRHDCAGQFWVVCFVWNPWQAQLTDSRECLWYELQCERQTNRKRKERPQLIRLAYKRDTCSARQMGRFDGIECPWLRCRYPKSAEFLRNSGLLQIDFTGFKSTESHTSVTSVFFERSFALNPVTDRQPSLLPGSLDVVTSWDVWDEAWSLEYVDALHFSIERTRMRYNHVMTNMTQRS